jgi:hypothetical protein
MKKGEIDETTKYLSDLFVSSGIPFRVIENKDFTSFVKSLISSYKLLRYNETKMELVNFFKSVDYLSITTDGWSARYIKSSFISLTTHYLDNEFLVKTVKLGIFPENVSHSADILRNEIIKILNQYNIEDKVKFL